MKAVRVHEYGGPEVLRYEDAPQPSPGRGEVLIRIAASGVNFIDVQVIPLGCILSNHVNVVSKSLRGHTFYEYVSAPCRLRPFVNKHPPCATFLFCLNQLSFSLKK